MKEELISNLSPLLSDESIGATLFFVMKSNETVAVKKADLQETIQPILANQFIAFLNRELIENDELSVMSLSSSDDRSKVVYKYDLEELPAGLRTIDEVINNDDLPLFSFTNDELSDVKGIIILIGNNDHQLAIYKQFYPILLMKRESILMLKKSSTRFENQDEDILKINEQIDFFNINGNLYIMNLASLEKFYGFHDILKKEAQSGILAIRNSNILENPDVLNDLLDDIALARKLIKVTTGSPVLAGELTNEAIINFTQSYPLLIGQFEYNDQNNRIVLHTKKAKLLFLKLLNDDFLRSELTKRHYDSVAKDNIE